MLTQQINDLLGLFSGEAIASFHTSKPMRRGTYGGAVASAGLRRGMGTAAAARPTLCSRWAATD